MDEDGRYTETERRTMDEVLRRKTRRDSKVRKLLFKKLRPKELLDLMTCSVPDGPKQEIERECLNYGDQRGASKFLDVVPMYNGWALQFLDALCHTGMEDVAHEIYPGYKPPPDDDEYASGFGGGNGGDGCGNNRSGGNSRNSGNQNRFANEDINTIPKEMPPTYHEMLYQDHLNAQNGRSMHESYQNEKLQYLNSMHRTPPDQSMLNPRLREQTSSTRSDAPSQSGSFHLNRSSVTEASSAVDQAIGELSLNELTLGLGNDDVNKGIYLSPSNAFDGSQVINSDNSSISENFHNHNIVSDRKVHFGSPSTSNLEQRPVVSCGNDEDNGNNNKSNYSFSQPSFSCDELSSVGEVEFSATLAVKWPKKANTDGTHRSDRVNLPRSSNCSSNSPVPAEEEDTAALGSN